ncbi:MAG: hypothetical protein K2J70_01390 [Muribaculaceae bacterium]|nr:hypothetical protein [Muribaculaceae bacterium]
MKPNYLSHFIIGALGIAAFPGLAIPPIASGYGIFEMPAVIESKSNKNISSTQDAKAAVGSDESSSYTDDEGNVHIYKDYFHFKLYSESFLGVERGAEVFPGWNTWDHSIDVLSMFPDGRIMIPSTIEYEGKVYDVVAFGEFGNIKGISEFILPPTLRRINHGALEAKYTTGRGSNIDTYGSAAGL